MCSKLFLCTYACTTTFVQLMALCSQIIGCHVGVCLRGNTMPYQVLVAQRSTWSAFQGTWPSRLAHAAQRNANTMLRRVGHKLLAHHASTWYIKMALPKLNQLNSQCELAEKVLRALTPRRPQLAIMQTFALGQQIFLANNKYSSRLSWLNNEHSSRNK